MHVRREACKGRLPQLSEGNVPEGVLYRSNQPEQYSTYYIITTSTTTTTLISNINYSNTTESSDNDANAAADDDDEKHSDKLQPLFQICCCDPETW